MVTYDILTLSLTGKYGVCRAEVVPRKCQAVGCDVIGLQETGRSGRTEFSSYICIYRHPTVKRRERGVFSTELDSIVRRVSVKHHSLF